MILVDLNMTYFGREDSNKNVCESFANLNDITNPTCPRFSILYISDVVLSNEAQVSK